MHFSKSKGTKTNSSSMHSIRVGQAQKRTAIRATTHSLYTKMFIYYCSTIAATTIKQ